MRRALVLVAIASAVACKNPRAHPPHGADRRMAPVLPSPDEKLMAPRPPSPATALDCERLPFASEIPLAEASGAVWLPAAGGIVFVVSDSGNHGAYLILDDDDGRVIASGQLPLGGPGDDLEGLASDGKLLWAITSSGYLRAWTAPPPTSVAADLQTPPALVIPAFRIDDDDPCKLTDVNCGRNFEGLCLVDLRARPTSADSSAACAGYAAAKTSGKLLCLVRRGDRYQSDLNRSIDVSAPKALAACDFGPDGAIWTGDNLFGGNQVRRITTGAAAGAYLGTGFAETMANAPAPNGDAIVFRFSDMGGSPSHASRYRCRGTGSTAAHPE